MNEERKLATIRKIRDIKPIEGADRISLAFVDGWQVVIEKGVFNIGDFIVYLEIDCRVPKDNPNFAFLEKRDFKIKSIKLKQTLSQGIIFPLSILPKKKWQEGDDVTKILNITKIEQDYKPDTPNDIKRLHSMHKRLMSFKIVKYMMRYEWFRKMMVKLFVSQKKKSGFPRYVPKTDESRCQNILDSLNQWKDYSFIVREKLDGSSGTYVLKRIGKNKYDYIVCSRNLAVGGNYFNKKANLYYDSNIYTEMSEKYDIENKLRMIIGENDWVAIQGEIIGEKIQGNKYGIQGRDLYLFNFITEMHGKHSCLFAEDYLKQHGFKWCPLLETDYKLPENGVEGLLCEADGMSILKHDTLREGIVVRNYEHNISFKVISNEFLLKYDSK